MLAPLRMDMSRLTHMNVCLRPFRAAGPRLDVETVGDKRVVHNYGHGGSGWSLAWGSAQIAARNALEGGHRDIAVIGCGALGLTAALTLQRAGASVTIYAAERTPQTRSARATGVWSPDSRIADAAQAPSAFGDVWERMARDSWAMHRTYVGLPGQPVFWNDNYMLRDAPRPDDAPSTSEPVVVNCTGYGARALWGDDTVTPVRGQISWLAPQPEVNYSLYYRGVSVVPRPDGIVVQNLGGSDMYGYGIDEEVADRAEAEQAINTVARLFDRT